MQWWLEGISTAKRRVALGFAQWRAILGEARSGIRFTVV